MLKVWKRKKPNKAQEKAKFYELLGNTVSKHVDELTTTFNGQTNSSDKPTNNKDNRDLIRA